MNKYQEALARIENDDYDFPNDFYGEDKATVKERDLDWIQEAVDKATPMKPRYRLSGNIKCGCGLQMYEEQQDWYRYCASCGQKIDWTEEK